LSLLLISLHILKLNADQYTAFNALALSHLEVSYSVGKFIGIDENYAELGVFAPLYLSNSYLAFLDCRGYRFNDSKWGESTGVGFRRALTNYHILGANLYYDNLEGDFHKSFNRLGVGLEWLGNCLDLRLNGYFPLGSETHSSKKISYENYMGDYHATCHEEQFSISRGFDAEIGGCFFNRNKFVAYGAVGTYYYFSKDDTNYFGGQARLEVFFNSIVSLQVKTSYDSVNHSHTQGRILLSIPLDFFCKKPRCFYRNKILQPIKRNSIIFTDKCCDYTWNW
jgi:hypothetical protein